MRRPRRLLLAVLALCLGFVAAGPLALDALRAAFEAAAAKAASERDASRPGDSADNSRARGVAHPRTLGTHARALREAELTRSRGGSTGARVGSARDDARARDEDLAQPLPVFLRPARVERGRHSIEIRGETPVGGESVVLYRRQRDRYLRVRELQSNPTGEFDFGQLLVPERGLQLVAVRSGDDPVDAPEMSRIFIAPTTGSPPTAQLLRRKSASSARLAGDDAGPAMRGAELAIQTRTGSARIVVASSAGEIVERIELAGHDPARKSHQAGKPRQTRDSRQTGASRQTVDLGQTGNPGRTRDVYPIAAPVELVVALPATVVAQSAAAGYMLVAQEDAAGERSRWRIVLLDAGAPDRSAGIAPRP